ncbi:MAG TPA: hypothetical protein VK835_09800 [Bacteroidia bacterium]|nr:hypothetical protein [Bacteroidia bacterium]
MRIYFFIAILIVFFSVDMMGQQNLNRTKKIVPINDTLMLDTLSLVTPTIKLYSNGNLIDTSLYKIIPERKQVVFNHKRLAQQHIVLDTINASYRVFPIDFYKEAYHKDIKDLQRDISIPQRPFTIKYNNDKDAQNFFASDGLTKNGSISRGISFGNNQDMVVNSNLNLQISGKLTKDIEVSLAATDNNIPVQPEGNTQQLQEFDKVFIQLKDKKSKLIVGDYQMQKPNGYFLNFYKRAQGLYFTNDYEIAKGAVLKTTVSGAITGGRFARNVIQGTENNQGPYRLNGADGELYIVVLSGTERVFINGQQLKRGQENDYVIDYNSGQITFTARQLITKDKRIEVEFQYSAKSYSRSVYFINEEVQTKKVRVAFSYYDEQDNKNKSLQQTLTDTDKVILYRIGDTLKKAYTNGYNRQPFNSTDVFYKRLDSTNITGLYKGIFVFTNFPDANDSAYKVNFSNVGLNNGNYIQIQSPANGVVYQWVQPISGVRQGSFEPIIPLVAPTKKQMITALTEIKTSATGVFGAEGAFTNYDINTLSPFDKKNDNGQGAKVYYNDKRKLGIEDSIGKQWALNYGGNYEYVQKNFTQVERFRSVEFFRDWNRTSDTIHNDQQIASLSAGLSKGSIFSTQYGANTFIEGSNYQAIKQNTSNSLNIGNSHAFYNSSYLSSDDNVLKTNFYRHKSKFSQRVKKIVLTYQDEFENNQFKSKPKNDSLLGKSYQFWEWEANITKADTTKNRFKLFYRERTDKFGFNNYLKRAAYAQNVGFSTDISTLKNHPIRTTFTYRKLQIIDTNLIHVKPDNNLVSRIEYSPKIIKGFFQANSFYEVGYGLEQKQQYSYVLVAAGQGQYTWKDYNSDGIKQLNEFEIAQYSDQATYIRVYMPTNTYIKSVRDQFSFSIYLRPKVFLKEDSKKMMKFVSKFVSQTTYKVDQKHVANTSSVSQYNPFRSNINDTSLLSSNFSFRQALFFNQTSPIYGFDFTYEDNRTKQLLTNGFESHRLQNNQLNTRWNITRAWGFYVTTILGNKFNTSQYFESRNYQIQTIQTQPKISYQPTTAFRISLSYQYSKKQNVITGGGEKALLNDFGAEFKFNKLSKGSFTLKADYINIMYNSDQNTPISFEMLNSLHAGQNITWSAAFQQNMSGNIQISITYEGRKTPGYKLVNIGGAQIRAFF